MEIYKNKKVLIVDDMRAVRIMLEKSLLKIGFLKENLSNAENGKKALDIVKAQPVDLVITDLNMDEMDGLEFLTATKATPGLEKIIFIVLTSDADKGRATSLFAAGASKLMLKPLNETELARLVGEVFKEA